MEHTARVPGDKPTAAARIYHDTVGETLTVWFGEPEREAICEETGAEVIIMKDTTGLALGVEVLNYRPLSDDRPITVEVHTL